MIFSDLFAKPVFLSRISLTFIFLWILNPFYSQTTDIARVEIGLGESVPTGIFAKNGGSGYGNASQALSLNLSGHYKLYDWIGFGVGGTYQQHSTTPGAMFNPIVNPVLSDAGKFSIFTFTAGPELLISSKNKKTRVEIRPLLGVMSASLPRIEGEYMRLNAVGTSFGKGIHVSFLFALHKNPGLSFFCSYFTSSPEFTVNHSLYSLTHVVVFSTKKVSQDISFVTVGISLSLNHFK